MVDGRINNSGKVLHGFGSYKKGGEKYKFYQVFLGLKARCNRKTHVSYKNYGGRGIKCEWKSFEEFKNDMYESYLRHCNEYGRKNTMLDRIDNDGNYCKMNCRWATRKEQNMNTRKTASVIVDGKEIKSDYLMKLCGLKCHGAVARICKYKKGIITKDDLFRKKVQRDTKIKYPKTVNISGVEYTSTTISKICGISTATARQRIIGYYLGKYDKKMLLYRGIKMNLCKK